MKSTRKRTRTMYFDMVVDGDKLRVQAKPFAVNGEETKFRVSFNGGPVYIFAWDKELNRLINTVGADGLPLRIESAIADQLHNRALRNDFYNIAGFHQ